jgi:hypothetical protein
MSKTSVSARKVFFGLTLVAAASQAHANLGTFSANEGYSLSIFTGTQNWCDVTMYNAGQYGPNSGGGPGPIGIAPSSSNWSVLPGAGGFYPNAAGRNAAYGTAPPYPAVAPAGVPVYIVGNHGPGRTDNSSLAFRNDTPAGSVGPARYDYNFDTYDTGGPAAASVTSGPVSFNIFMASSPGVPGGTGQHFPQKFHQSFMDSAGNIGAQWGYALDNEIIWRDGPSSLWNYTGLYTNGAWDGMTVNIDLTADTFELKFFDAAGNITTTLAPAGTPLGTPMTNFTSLRWQLEDGINAGVGGKNFFDDAKLTIPAPGSLALLGLGALAASRRRRA